LCLVFKNFLEDDILKRRVKDLSVTVYGAQTKRTRIPIEKFLIYSNQLIYVQKIYLVLKIFSMLLDGYLEKYSQVCQVMLWTTFSMEVYLLTMRSIMWIHIR